MLKLLCITTFISCSTLFGQQKTTTGLVVDELGMLLSNVRIQVKGDRLIYFSDCDGAYKFKASIGDTLVFSKEGFFTTQKVITRLKKNKTMVGFDYPSMRDAMDKDPHWIKFKTVRNGQPLYIIDHIPYVRNAEGNNDLKTEDVLSTKTVKGQQAEDYFGIYGRNGVVLFYTKCK